MKACAGAFPRQLPPDCQRKWVLRVLRRCHSVRAPTQHHCHRCRSLLTGDAEEGRYRHSALPWLCRGLFVRSRAHLGSNELARVFVWLRACTVTRGILHVRTVWRWPTSSRVADTALEGARMAASCRRRSRRVGAGSSTTSGRSPRRVGNPQTGCLDKPGAELASA
jgi:hypothetical protein